MDYQELPGTAKDNQGLPRTIMDYHENMENTSPTSDPVNGFQRVRCHFGVVPGLPIESEQVLKFFSADFKI